MRAHLSINVRNLKSSVDFYSSVFGVLPQKRSKTYAKFDLKDPYFNLSMHEVSDGRAASKVNHLGIEVMSEEEVEIWQKKVDALGVKILIEEDTDCCFAKQDKFWFKDPDGNSWEVFFVHEQLPVTGAEPPRNVKIASSCDTSSGCC